MGAAGASGARSSSSRATSRICFANDAADEPSAAANFTANDSASVRNVATLVKNALITGRREGWSPLWSSHSRSLHPPTPGLWAVEPHLGFRGVGAKFEELLVVTETDAYWLDDDLPHVRRWLERGLLTRTEVAA